MKKIYFLFLVLANFMANSQQKRQINPISNNVSLNNTSNFRVGCSLFTDANNFTNGSTFSYNAPTNNNSNLVTPANASLGCMYSVPNQAWFIITVTTGGNLYFNFSNSNNFDVDAVIWGPIANNDVANACAATTNYPLTCDWDAARPDLYINNAQVGQKYVMLVTNFSNANTVINISQPTGGSVNYSMANLPNCALVPTATISGTSTTVNEGQSTSLSLNFTGSSPWNYTLSDGTSGTTNTSPINLTLYPLASQTYTINSVNNLCGTNSGSGSVGISVVRNVQLRSCFPLDGDVSDSQNLNTGTLGNGVSSTTNRANEANKALQFDGIDDFATIGTNNLNNNTFAFGAWVKLDEVPNINTPERMVFSLGGGVTDEHYLGVEFYNGAASWKFSSNGTTIYSTAVVDTDWHLLLGVRTGGQLKMYVDGMLTGTNSLTGATTYGSPLHGRIGAGVTGNKLFKGKIDDVKIFSGSLIDPEIVLLQNYNNCNNVFNDSYISVQSISTAVICTGTPFTVRAFSNNLSIDPGLQFSVELSDINGSFNNPTTIGTSNFLPLTATVPTNTPQGNYKLRIRYGGQVSVNSLDIFVNQPATYNITGTTTITDGQSTNLNLNFGGSGPWNYVLSNGLSGAATTSTWPLSITPDQTTTYSVTSVRNVCGIATLNGSSSVTVTVNFPKELVTCFPFNVNANDEKNNNTTTIQGPILTENRFGQTNSAYLFNGTNNYIEYTANNLRKREFTMSAWVFANNTSSTQYILSQGEINSNSFQALAMTSSGWQFQSYSNGGLSTATSTTTWAANQWVHLTAVRTYSQLRLYVNGNLVATTSNSSFVPFKASDIGRIGASSSSALSNFFNGRIDDVRLYRGALNDDEVFALFANTTHCPTIENAPILIARTLAPSTICTGQNLSINYTTSNLTVSAGSPIQVQLSDQNGSFNNPTVIGTGSSSPITATIPVNAASSAFYRVRLIATSGPITSVNTQSLNISGSTPTATISGGGSITFGGTATLNISFTGPGPWTYTITGASTQTTSSNPVSINVSPTTTTTYSVTSVSNSCGAGTMSGSATVTVAPNISLGTISSSYCQGQTFNVSFTPNYTPTPNFRVELSDANGNFTSPVTIGTGTSSPISVIIPVNTIQGTSYRIRIASNTPAYISPLSSTFTINQQATATLSGTTIINEGQSTNLTINFTGTAPWTYAINNGTSQVTSTNPLTVSVAPLTTTTYTITSLSNPSCTVGNTSGSATITVNPVAVRLVSCYPFNGNANDSKGLNNGTVTGATLTTDRFGNPNSAYNFDGDNDYIQAGTAQMLNQNYTYSFWFNFTTPPAGGAFTYTLVRIGNDNSSHHIQINIFYSLQTSINIFYESPGAGENYNNLPINLGQWYHFALTRNGSSYASYLNGSLLTSYTAGTGNSTYPTNSTLYIGGLPSFGFPLDFIGKIDDVQIYKGALTAQQISYIYNSQLNCDDPTIVPVLTLNSLPNTNFCQNQASTISFTSANINPTAGNPINVELSDATGAFTNPTVIGTSTATSGNINIQIPANQPTGAGYKIRLKQGNVISSLSATIAIGSPASATLSGTTTINEGQSANLTINFTGSAPYTYTITGGNSQTTSSNPLVIAVSPLATTTYNVTTFSNACGNGIISGSATITVNPVAVRLVSCYPFNGNANDSKGLNNGTVVGATLTTDRFGNPNSAYSFDGNNDYIQATTAQMLNQNYTYSFWFNFDIPPNSGALPYTIIRVGDDNSSHRIEAWYDLVYKYIYMQYRSPDTNLSANYLPISLGQWHHFIITKNGNNYAFYLNGNLLASPVAGTSNASYPTSSILFIGGLPSFGFPLDFIGKIDDVQIYKGALTAGQVQNLYNIHITNSQGCYDATTYTCLTNASYSSILSGQQTFQTSNRINASGTIQSGANIHFDAKGSVVLEPGFKTEANTIFRATAGGGCN